MQKPDELSTQTEEFFNNADIEDNKILSKSDFAYFWNAQQEAFAQKIEGWPNDEKARDMTFDAIKFEGKDGVTLEDLMTKNLYDATIVQMLMTASNMHHGHMDSDSDDEE